MNAKVNRDAFGVFSEKNSLSKYWGVTLAKKESGYTVRFFDKVNMETILFKAKTFLSESVAASIAARFFDDRFMYCLTPQFDIQIEGAIYSVNNCTNTISLLEQKVKKSPAEIENQESIAKSVEKGNRPNLADFDFLGYEKGTMSFELTEKGFEIPA